MSNALVMAYQQNLQGALGAYANEIAWLPAAFVMTNVSMNLLLVKFRQQFGLRLFTEAFLVLYAIVAAMHLLVNELSSAIAVRAAHGMTGAALSSLGIYYTLQAFPPTHRMKGLVVALGLPSLALPLARLLPIGILELAEWRGLYLFELGLTLMSLGCVLLLKLPPGDHHKAFEKLDFVTFAFFAPGMALLCAALSLGRIAWWRETAWIGWALAGSIALLTTALLIEHNRSNPLINTRWWASGAVVRLFMTMLLIRIVLSEQTTGAVGLMQSLGMSNDQMHAMFLAVLVGTIAGTAASAMTLKPPRFDPPILIALMCMMAGALMDAGATSQTRPGQMITSQFLIAFGGSLFLGPALLSEIGSVIAQPRNLVSFAVMFGMSQNLGGLVGSALMGSLQTWREKFHSSHIVEHLTLLSPEVAASIQSHAGAYATVLGDATLRSTQGTASLAAAATREANVLAYNDIFLCIALLAAGTALLVMLHPLWRRLTSAPPPRYNPASAAPTTPRPASAAPVADTI
jgi:MFS family permease